MNGRTQQPTAPSGAMVQMTREEVMEMNAKQNEINARNTALNAAINLNTQGSFGWDVSELIDAAEAIKLYLLDGGTVTTEAPAA